MRYRAFHNDPKPSSHPLAGHAELSLHDRIRQRAYEIFQQRPGESDLQNWLEAEREILEERRTSHE